MTTITTAQTLLAAATIVSRAMTNIRSLDEASADVRQQVTDAKQAVTNALDTDGDFDLASRAFKAANNKLDKLLERRETLANTLSSDLDAVRDALAALAADVRQLEA